LKASKCSDNYAAGANKPAVARQMLGIIIGNASASCVMVGIGQGAQNWHLINLNR